MKFLKNFKLFEEKEWDMKELDPFDEEYWEEESFMDRKNYIEYDNIEQGHSNYPEGAPVLLKDDDQARRGVRNINPYELGFIHDVRPFEPTYNVMWSRLGRIRNHYSYDLLYHKDYIPEDWTPGQRQGFTMGDKILYELVFNWNEPEARIEYNINRKDPAYQRRVINIPNATDYIRNVPIDCFRQFLDTKYGYIQDCLRGNNKYDKDVMYFTNEFDLNADSIKGFTTLIKRRMSAYQARYTRNVKKDDDSVESKRRQIANYNVDLNLLDQIDYNEPFVENNNGNWVGVYTVNGRFFVKKVDINRQNYGRNRTYARFDWGASFNLGGDFNENTSQFYVGSQGNKSFMIIRRNVLEEVKDRAEDAFRNEITNNRNIKVAELEQQIQRLEERKRVKENRKATLSRDKRAFQLVDIIGDYLV